MFLGFGFLGILAMKKPNVDLHLRPKQLQTLGLLSASWSFFETEMDFTISALGYLVENDQRMPSPFNRRAQRWRKLARTHYKNHPGVLSDAELLIDAAQNLHKGRCIALHGRIYGDPKKKSDVMRVETHRHRKEWQLTRSTETVSSLMTAIRETKKLAKELIIFNQNNLRASPTSLPRKYI